MLIPRDPPIKNGSQSHTIQCLFIESENQKQNKTRSSGRKEREPEEIEIGHASVHSGVGEAVARLSGRIV